MQHDQRVLTVTEEAARRGVSRMTILRKLASGELKGRMVGRQWVIAAGSVDAKEQEAGHERG
jgi:excisionase family DNA binding protein